MLVRLLLMLILTGAPLAAQAQTPTANDAAQPSALQDDRGELEAIHTTSREFLAAFNNQNANAIAKLWTPDGDYVDESGQVFAGRAAIEKAYADFFQNNPGVTIHVAIDSLRLLSDVAAIEDGRAILDPTPPGAPASSSYTVVHVKVEGKWLMSTVRDTRVETPSGYHHVADLEWLIGQWTAEEHGSRMVSDCRWVANKSFVERTHKVTRHDHTTSSGVQLIGFNPQSGQVQSWDFSSDGGHAVGVWTPTNDGWQAQVSGVTGEGVRTSAINLLTRIDDNAYVWRSFERTKGNTPLPDMDEVVLRRGDNP